MVQTTDLGPEFLRRVRIATMAVGALGVLFLTGYAGLKPGAAALAGIAISLVNLKLLEDVFLRILRPGEARRWKLALALGLKFPILFGGVILALGPLRLPPLWFLAGFTLFLAVTVLKVAGRLLTSRSPRKRGAAPCGQGGQGSGALSGGSRPGRTTAVLLTLVLAGSARAGGGLADRTAAPSLDSPAGGDLAAATELAQADPDRGQAADETATEGHGTGGNAVDEHGAEGLGGIEQPGGEHAEGEHPAGEHGEGEHEEHPPELPNIIHILHLLFPDQVWAQTLYRWQNPVFAGLVMIFLCVMAVTTYRRRTLIPGPVQNVAELLVESFSNFILGILGPRGKEFIPFLGTLFLFIWLNNLQGLVPLLKSPTSVYNTTLALAICVFVYVQYTGMTKLGPIGYFHHMMGSPRDLIGWIMVPLMLPLHLIEEVAKPVSLSLRLFGNILGEDVLLGVFAGLGIALLAFMKLPLGVPLHLPFIFLALLLSTIQALVFTLLASIYFLQMLPHDDHEEEHGH